MPLPRPALLLASSSPRRQELLRQHRYEFTVQPAGIEELTPAHLTPGETALLNAMRKAAFVAAQHPSAVVVAADTLVALGDEILGKPRDLDEAFSMVSRLSGRMHEVFSGVWIARRSTAQARGFVEVSRVRFRKLATDEIREYLARIEPLDKAGAYAAQDDPSHVIESIEGSVSNVIGLPMEALARALRDF